MSGRRIIVGLCGPALSGKDTLAKALITRGWHRGAFADALKQQCEPVIGKSPEAMSPADKEFWRPLYVCVGELRRRQNPAYWIGELQAHLWQHVEPSRPVVVTDVRYANEIAWVRQQGGLVVLLVRPGYPPANAVEKRNLVECAKRIPHHDTIINAGTISGGRAGLLELVRRHYGKVARYE